MNELSAQPQGGLAMSEMELLDVLQVSIYPGAARPSIKLAIAYCNANSLDIFQKPVHIVPMWDKNSKSMRDVIMPGIGLYRTQASRSGEHAGTTEPEFGPIVSVMLDGVAFNIPEWCRVTVSRDRPNGRVAEFTSKEYWLENYATAGKDSTQPNTMWKKRSMGQLGKCAEAQALRKAFPEMISAAPTADEMEGKTMAYAEVDITPAATSIAAVAAPAAPSADLLARANAAADKGRAAFLKTWGEFSKPERAQLHSKLPDFEARCAKVDTAQGQPAATLAVTAKAPAIGPEYDDLVADMEATADEGIEAFEQSWARLSAATRAALAGIHAGLQARAAATGIVS